MLRTLSFLFGALTLLGRQGLPDPAFDRIPFDEWRAGVRGERQEARFRFSLHLFPSQLTVHQRLGLLVATQIDGGEFVKRSAPGQIVVFLEIRDRLGHAYRVHRAMAFDGLARPARVSSVNFDQSVFIKPGDYRVTSALYDTETKEHSIRQAALHVGELSHDPLPDSWGDLPAVEFLSSHEPPDSWYRPEISSRLRLPVQTAEPVKVEVVVNESQSEMATFRPGRANRRNLGSLIPALKVLSQLDLRNGSMNVTLLDLERRKASFSQENVGTLDWAGLRSALLENDPNRIDVHALEHHEQNAQFFVSQIKSRLERDHMAHKVLIVLSGLMAFAKGQDLTPIEATAAPGTLVYYLRFYPPRIGPSTDFSGRGGRGPGPDRMPPGRGGNYQDSLVGMLKPLAPRRFDITSPEDFRAALAAIINDISKLK